MDPLTKTTIAELNDPKARKVLILGGGFGGIKAALELADSVKFDVSLVSDNPNFRYYPMLYRTATGGSKQASSIPLSEIFAGKDVKIIHDTAKNLDRAAKAVVTAKGKKLSYDFLIVGLGSVTNFFGIKGLKENAFGIKTNQEAQRLRDHLHKQLQDELRPDINYIVIGGGATGVELAGALPGYIKHIMKRHGLPPKTVNVAIVEAQKKILPAMRTKYSSALAKRLKKLGVKLYLNQKVLAETAESLTLSGRSLLSETVIWTAGVTTNPFLASNKFALSEHGKAVVDEYLQSEPGIFVVGDNADTMYSGMAQTAMHDGLFVASHLKRLAAGKQLISYQPRQPVYIIPAGPFWAAVSWGKRDFFGPLGWLLRKAADFRAYNDLEPWWRASKRWIAESEDEESCAICAPRR